MLKLINLVTEIFDNYLQFAYNNYRYHSFCVRLYLDNQNRINNSRNILTKGETCDKTCKNEKREIFGRNHKADEEITVINNELFINLQNGSQLERITDSNFRIEGIRYHIESQSKPDGSMLMRIFEYDSQIALQDANLDDNTLRVDFPHTAVLYLRSNKNTPEQMELVISVPGDECRYQVPVMKVQKYSVDEIFEKKLYFLVPFHIFVYEYNFAEYDTKEEQLKKLKIVYQSIMHRLEQHTTEGIITEYIKQTIIDMSKKVLEHICAKYDNVKNGVREIMGGKVLEYEAKTILRRGIQQGMEAGARQQLIEQIKKKLAKKQSFEQIADALEESVDTIVALIVEHNLA